MIGPRTQAAALQGVPASGFPPGAAGGAVPGDNAPLAWLRTLTILCVALPLAAFVAVGTYRYRQISIETGVRLDRTLRIATEHALKVLDTNETLLLRVEDAAGPPDAAGLRAREGELHARLKAMSANRPQVQSIWIWGADGHQVASDRYAQAPADLDVSSRAYFQWHREHKGGIYISEPLLGKSTGERFFDMSRGLYRPDGSFAGVVSVSLFPVYFTKFHAELAADEPGLAITMFRSDGAVLSRYPTMPGFPDRMAPDSPVMKQIRAGETGGHASGVSSVDGRERLVRFTKLGDYPIYLGSGMESARIWRRWFEEMAWLAAFGLPPMVGLYLAARLALRRTRMSLQTAGQLNDEMQARRRVEEALFHAQKLEALGRLTGGVAHDFNNALMVISTNLYLLKRKPEAAGRYVESIGKAVESATKLTRQLLAFSRRQALVLEHVDLRQHLPSLQDLIAPVLGSGIRLTIQVAPDTPSIMVDTAELELALLNLAINARDAMPGGGEFSVRAGMATGDMPPLLKKGPMCFVDVTDTGTGIEAAVIAKVFEPFFTTKPVGQGTGLGLSQVYGLCQRAGGLAEVRSQLGQGTTVRLYFPAVSQPPQAPGAPVAAQHRQLGLRVLFVEDNDEVAAALMQVLDALGCSVQRFDRATPAFEWLSNQAQLPDLLLSDVVMPGPMDGAALAQKVRAAHPDLRIVLMTGYAQQLETITRLGFEVLPKPCSAERLAEVIGAGVPMSA